MKLAVETRKVNIESVEKTKHLAFMSVREITKGVSGSTTPMIPRTSPKLDP